MNWEIAIFEVSGSSRHLSYWTGNMQRIDVIFWTTIFLWSCSNIGTYLLFGEEAIIPSDLVFVGFLLIVIIVSKISKKANRWLGTKI